MNTQTTTTSKKTKTELERYKDLEQKIQNFVDDYMSLQQEYIDTVKKILNILHSKKSFRVKQRRLILFLTAKINTQIEKMREMSKK